MNVSNCSIHILNIAQQLRQLLVYLSYGKSFEGVYQHVDFRHCRDGMHAPHAAPVLICCKINSVLARFFESPTNTSIVCFKLLALRVITSLKITHMVSEKVMAQCTKASFGSKKIGNFKRNDSARPILNQ